MEPRQVDVLQGGAWLSGWLLAARRDPGGSWVGLVRYTTTPGMQYYHWREQDTRRRRGSALDQHR